MHDSLSHRNCSCFKRAHNPMAMQELKKVNWNLQVSLGALPPVQDGNPRCALRRTQTLCVHQGLAESQ